MCHVSVWILSISVLYFSIILKDKVKHCTFDTSHRWGPELGWAVCGFLDEERYVRWNKSAEMIKGPEMKVPATSDSASQRVRHSPSDTPTAFYPTLATTEIWSWNNVSPSSEAYKTFKCTRVGQTAQHRHQTSSILSYAHIWPPVCWV